MLTETRAIVLHSLKYGDNQRIVDVFTEGQGYLTFICHVSSSSKGKIKKQFFQPLTILRVVYDYRPKAGMQHFRDLSIDPPLLSIPFDPYKLSIAMFVAEFLLYAIKNEQKNIPLFTYIQKSIEWLDTAVNSFSNFHLVFMIHLSAFLGFYPNLEDYSSGDIFDMRNGCFLSTLPLHTDYIAAGEAVKMKNIMKLTYKTMHLYTLSHEERNQCIEVIIHYYKLHIPSFRDMHSLDVFKALFT
ncbi:MAG TPA: DNA repair protein RecO [Prevotella sp.]|jgi:DNA repair protein RecO (recombination protein O)|nr:DNA repair protein RecO [Prevotella sp.]